ncbi:serine/threonine-protein kinase [Actinomadura sp. NPDC048394]|uniref:serine/threonine protein kinase n=1 Tax=Actinomadura sp. NPDC048394 TaxID=3158223 RepID=UPI0033E1CDAE
MTNALNLVVAGDVGLSQKLRGTGRFPAVFDVASATELRSLSKSGEVQPPAAFMFAPGFDEDLPDVRVTHLANGLAAAGFTVLVHCFFTQRGDRFSPGVLASAEPMSLSQLLTTLGAAPPVNDEQPDLLPEPPPEPWVLPGVTAAGQTGQAWPADEPPAIPVQSGVGDEPVETPPGYGELTVTHRGVAAVTYRAVHEESGTMVALRIRHDGVETPPDELAALERASLSDHMVTVLESGRTPAGQVYTASEHCLAYPSEPPLPLQEAVDVAFSLGMGLQALHEQGLIHGDVNPGRIMSDAGRPLLSGAASLRGLAVHSAPGMLEPVDFERIDPGVAAPEVLRGRPATAASDVYGLGATLWSLLAGHAPFTGDDRWAVRERVLTEAVPPLPRDDVPEWLANLLSIAMAREPAERYPTARAFTDAIEEGMRGVPESPTDWESLLAWPSGTTVSEPGGAGRRRKPVMALLAVFAVLVLAGVGISTAGLMAGDDREGAQRRRPSPSRTETSPSNSSPGPTSTPTPVKPIKEYAPGRVRIADARVSIEVAWADRSGGRAAYYIVGGPVGRTPSTLASAPPGTAKVTVTALNPSVDYCLTVVAVVDVDRVAHAEPVCTHRVKRVG